MPQFERAEPRYLLANGNCYVLLGHYFVKYVSSSNFLYYYSPDYFS